MTSHSPHPPIIDFETVLESMLLDENHVWGKKNKPRNLEPDMFEIMSWEEKDRNIHDFKSNNRNLLKSSEIVKYKHQINRGGNIWKTENQDAFRTFIYSPTKKSAVFPEMDATMKETLITSQKQRPLSAESRVIITKQGEIIPEEVYFDHLDHHFTSENLDQYALKNVTTVGDLQRELAANANESSLYRNKPRVHSDKNETKQLIPKKIQVKPFVYDNKGNLIGSQEDYFTEVLSQNKGTNVLYNPKESLENQENILYNTNNTKETIDKSKALYNSKNEEEIHIPKQDYSGVKSKLLNTKTVKKARILDPYEEADKLARRKERIRKFGEQTKSLANSAFTTYYGKPAFENYGRGNIKPAAGGLIYGNYMKTHNVNPHRGNKNPHFKQTYNNALMYGSRMPACEPELPRKVKEDYRLSQKQVESLRNRNPLSPDENNIQQTYENQKIQRPDLVNSLRFASEEVTPVNSPKNRGMGRSSLTSLQKEQQAIRKKLSSKSAKHTEQKQYKTILKDVLIDKSSKAKKKASILLQNSQITHENKENTSENPILYENNYIQAPFHKEDPSYKRGLYETEEKSRKTKLSKKEKARNKEIELQAEQEEKLYPEHEEKVNRKFIKSIKEKKEYTNRLAPKVTEVYPISKAPEKEENQRKIQEKDHEVIIDQM